jgi:hypothetical protein
MRAKLGHRITLEETCQAKARYPSLREAKAAARERMRRRPQTVYAYQCNVPTFVHREDGSVRPVLHFHTATRLPFRNTRRKE